MALEQPQLSWGKAPDFTDPDFMAGFGFLPDRKHDYNPDVLPVGFAKTENYLDPQTNETNTVIGLTCARLSHRSSQLSREGNSHRGWTQHVEFRQIR